MAFDQNAIPKDLRPLNIVRAVTDDTRIATTTSTGRHVEGFYANPPRDSSPNSVVYYTPTASDPGYVGLGPLPVPALAPAPAPAPISGVAAVAAWVPRVVARSPVAMAATAGMNVGSGAVYGHSTGARSVGSPSDHASDEGGDDSVSGRKVKFMCSFGGNIRPRPGDGALRYVGGQTRIISVRRGITFGEFVQKMMDIYGQSVVIKYQLPDEDFDALVSIYSPDDLENMMEEYEKMVERSSDGSAKLRIFLFSSSEADSASMAHIGDWHVNAQKYVEAVNGLADGCGREIIGRIESNASAVSTQSSDINPAEVVEGCGHGEITSPVAVGVLSPRDNPTASQETTARYTCGDRSPAVHVEACDVQSGSPASNYDRLPVSLHTEKEFEKSVPVNAQQERVVGLQHALPTTSPYLYAYGDPQSETLNRSDFVQPPAQIGFPASMMGAVSPVLTQQQISAINPSHQQFLHMTMVPSSNPNMVQSQQILLEPYPGESPMGKKVVHMPADQGFHAYHAQVPHAMMGCAYGWQQIPQAEHVAFSEGLMPRQQVVAQEEFSRVEDCYMCQKALPHAHSDTIAQDNRESPSSRVLDFKPIYHSLQLDDQGRPVNKQVVGAFGEPFVEQRGTKPQPRVVGTDVENLQFEGHRIPQNVEVRYDVDRIHQRAENSELPRLPAHSNATGGMQSPYGTVVGTIPQTSSDSASLQAPTPIHYQLMQDSAVNKSPIAESPVIGSVPLQSSDYILHESPKVSSGNISAAVAAEDTSKPAYDHIQDIGGRLGNLRASPPEPSKSPTENPKREDILESRPQQVYGRDTYLDAFNKPRPILGVDHSKPKEMPSSSLHKPPCMPNLPEEEYHEAAQPPPLVDIGMYGQSKLGVNLVPDEISSHNPSSAAHSSHSSERIPPIIDWEDTAPVHQPNTVSSGGEVQSDASSSVSPSYLIEDLHESSNTFFNQDPWNMRLENNFPPPRPSKIQLSKKESFGTRDAPRETRFDNVEFLMGSDNGAVTGDRVSSAYTNLDASSEHSQPSKGSAEELIKQELQAIAEGVAASVLQTPATSNVGHVRSDETSLNIQNNEVNIIDKGVDNDVLEEVKARVPEKINPGFPVPHGRLQIIKNGDLEEIKELGSGTFGTVYYGKWRGTDVAIKRINDRCFVGKPSEVQRMRDDFWNEANILADLHHPNVVAFYGVVLDGPGGSFATVTEYMVNGSLRTALQKSERNLDKRKRILIAMDVAFGMEYLHEKKIVHFDLKSDNLLVNLRDPHRPICKVGDLGLSKVKCQTLISGGVRGTLPWMAPELLNGSSNLVSEKVDVYSFGIVMWELLTGEEPYADLHYGAIIGGIVSNTLRPAVPESCDSDWKSLMERCWAAEPSERPTFPEVANELRAMASKIPPKGQQQAASKQAQAKS